MKNYIFLSFIILFIQGCKKDEVQPIEPKVYSTKLDGKYDLITIYTESPVDLNRDSSFSTDLKMEIPDLKDTTRFFLELSTTYYSPGPNQIIDQWMPFTNLIQDNNGNFVSVLYGLKNLIGRYYYDEKNNKISVAPIGAIEIVSIDIVEQNKLKVASRMYFYTSNGWELLNLEGTYKKRAK